MEYIQANEKHTDRIFHLVQETINVIYPDYYPKEVVDFFCSLHSREKLKLWRGMPNGLYILQIIDDLTKLNLLYGY